MNFGRILKASILPSSMPIANNEVALNWTILNQSPCVSIQDYSQIHFKKHTVIPPEIVNQVQER